MQKKINKLYKKIQLIIESYALGEETYSSKVDELIDELAQIKNNLKKGKNRKFFRKEASRIQNAIQTLRYLKRKSEREIMKKNDKILISESELIRILDRKGSINVNEATLASDNFGNIFGDLVSAKDNFYRAYKGLTSSSSNEASASDVLGVIKNGLRESGSEMKNRYRQPKPGAAALSPSLIQLIVNARENENTLCIFSLSTAAISHVIATYDNKFYDSSESTGFYGDKSASALEKIDPTAAAVTGDLYVGQKNKYTIDPYPVVGKGSIDSIVSNLNSDLNNIIKGFNQLFKGISEIPENQSYSNSVYSATNIANDINRLFNVASVKIDVDKIKKIILRDIEQKQDFGYFTLSPDKKVQLKEGSVRTLAAAIVSNIKDYYIDELQKSKAYFLDTLTKLDRMIYISSKGKHMFNNIYKIGDSFDNVISDLRNIIVK